MSEEYKQPAPERREANGVISYIGWTEKVVPPGETAEVHLGIEGVTEEYGGWPGRPETWAHFFGPTEDFVSTKITIASNFELEMMTSCGDNCIRIGNSKPMRIPSALLSSDAPQPTFKRAYKQGSLIVRVYNAGEQPAPAWARVDGESSKGDK